MVRTSKHILKYQTNFKDSILDRIYQDNLNCLKYYISLITSGKLPLRTYLSSKDLPIYSNIVHSQWRAIIYKKASEIVRSNVKYQLDRRFKAYKKVYAYFKRENRQLEFLSKRFKELKLTPILKYIKIEVKDITLEINYLLFNVEIDESKEFDEFIRISSPYREEDNYHYISINLPLKHHAHSNIMLTH